MNEVILLISIVFSFLFSIWAISTRTVIFIAKTLIIHLFGFAMMMVSYFIASFSEYQFMYYMCMTTFFLIIFIDNADDIFYPFISFKKIHNRMMLNPEQRINYKIFKEIFNIDPKSFDFDGDYVCYIDENGNQRIFYSNYLDLFRILKTIENYETKGINSNATPITDDMMKKIRKEHERAEKEKQEAIKGLTELSEDWDKIELK